MLNLASPRTTRSQFVFRQHNGTTFGRILQPPASAGPILAATTDALTDLGGLRNGGQTKQAQGQTPHLPSVEVPSDYG